MKVNVQPKVFESFPDTAELIVVLRNVNNNTKYSREILTLLKDEQKSLRERMGLEAIESEPKYSYWVNLYKSVLEKTDLSKNFKTNTLPSHVALTKRVLHGKDIPNINPLVNFYNYMSIKWGVAFGGEDLSKYVGDVELRYMSGGERFLGISESEVAQSAAGEISWIDEHSIVCRMWGWRQSDRTKVVNDTTDVIFYIDLYTGEGGLNSEQVNELREEFTAGVKKYFGAECESFLLDAYNNSAQFDYKVKSLMEYGGQEAVENYFNEVGSDAVLKGTKGIRKRKAESMALVDNTQLMNSLQEKLNAVLTKSGESFQIELSESMNQKFGDFSSTSALKYAKELKQAPREIGQKILDLLKNDSLINEIFQAIELAPNGFINFKLADHLLYKQVGVALEDTNYGQSEVGENRVVLVESPGWNPNKAPHVGHMLNLFLGKTLYRLFESISLKPKLVDIDNDKGIPVMQTIWAYINSGADSTPESADLAPDIFVDQLYKKGKKAYEEEEGVKEQVQKIQQKWEAGDNEIRALWEKLINWARQGQRELMAQYGEAFDADQTHESDVYNKGKEIIHKYEGQGIIEKLPDGAYIARIEQEYGVPDTIVIKSDGTGLYHTQDIALLVNRMEKYSPWRMIYVVAEEQIAHFQRLFSIVDALGLMQIDNIYHFAYGWVVGKDGKKLSSRGGGQLYASELLENLVEASKVIMSERESKLEGEKAQKIAKAVAIGAVKYSLLSRDPFKTIKFDMEEALSFNGKSGPYIMYAYTRGKGILAKIGHNNKSGADFSGLKFNEFERALILKLLNYPKIVLDAANNYYPGLLADYLYDVAKLFNNFYENVNVSRSTESEQLYRSNIIELTTNVLKSGLAILGIEVLDEM